MRLRARVRLGNGADERRKQPRPQRRSVGDERLRELHDQRGQQGRRNELHGLLHLRLRVTFWLRRFDEIVAEMFKEFQG